ncbi:MAG: DapH/DapD/GlmU-related protein, partial [Candidatus Hadarchaeota archaeon]|nr:DapH/DapD/GlmU-related protein [Candidatus Hadarchaeota archaeon]
GDRVVVGHQALVHGATVSDNSLVGAGSIVFSGVRVGEDALVGMGAVVLKGEEVPPHTIVVGIPARSLRKLKDKETKYIRVQVERYDKLAERYKKAEHR